MRTRLEFVPPEAAAGEPRCLLVIGRAERLRQADVLGHLPGDVAEVWGAMLEAAAPGDAGGASCTFATGAPQRVIACVLPEACSRHNSPARPHAISALVAGQAPGEGTATVLLALDDAEHAMAAGCAVARALPAYQRKSGASKERAVRVAMLGADEVDLERVARTAEAVRGAARLVDMPPSELNTTVFVDVARDTAARLDAEITVLEGEELGAGGFGGLWGVGKAATHGPALVILEYSPRQADAGSRTVCLVGKGIVYDTGGLSIKGKDHMPGMKGDMGGAAAVLGAFTAAVQRGTRHRVYALLCLAENSVGPESTRPDDILTLYSGKTVEVNNTDAEGRLVLGDGVAYATRHLRPDVVIDVATLTGAQLIATGHRHAAAVCNDDDLEALAVKVGRRTGDLVHPLPYCPEFFRKEFKSKVADLKNSVKDRMNAQSSCAAQFVAEHLVNFDGRWLHLDIAGPSGDGELGTGYGVALLDALLEEL